MNALQAYSGSLFTAGAVVVAVVLALLVFRMISNRVRGGVGARLSVSEYQDIDKSRRLVLVRRDDVEHLLLIGGSQDVVVETGIESPLMTSSSGKQIQTAPMPVNIKPANVQPLRPAPRPAIFGGNRPPLRTVEPATPTETSLTSFRPERE
jgi:hypothetical protein